MITHTSKFIRDRRRRTAHYVIDGEPFGNVRHAFVRARDLGYTGTESGFRERLSKGIRTWTELLAPPATKTNTRALKKTREKKAAEMHALCVELDRRKAQLQGPEEGEDLR